MNAPAAKTAAADAAPVLCVIGQCDLRLWALTPAERLQRQFGGAAMLSLDAARAHPGPVVFVRADAVIDQPLIPILKTRPDLLLIGDDGAPLAVQTAGSRADAVARILAGEESAGGAFEARRPSELDAQFWKALRKRETPYAFRISPAGQDAMEWRIFMGTYKGATDLVTKHLWPRPAFIATRILAPLGITPNMVTLLGAILVFAAFWLFWQGHYGWGLAAAWLMTFLDTVDGKLARTTLTSSKWGDVFDHGLDLVHPPFWYWAWAAGLGAVGLAFTPQTFWIVLAAILGGYVLQRIMEGIAIKWLGLEIHIWRPVDTLFRQITARRNPNLVVLTAFTIIGRPDWGLLAVAWWTIICLVLHGLQLVQAFQAKRQAPLESWMSQRS